jgi:hypothetical protein
VAVSHGFTVAGPTGRVRRVADRVGGNAIHFRWSQDGTYQRIFDAVRLAGLLRQSVDPDLEQLLSADSTVVRAHQHAAGARRSSVGAPSLATPAQDTGGTIELHDFAGRAS